MESNELVESDVAQGIYELLGDHMEDDVKLINHNTDSNKVELELHNGQKFEITVREV